jgi:hypothetical protein
MAKKFTDKEAIEDFQERVRNSPLLNFAFSSSENLEVIPSDLDSFFETFLLGRPFTFQTFFEDDLISPDGTVGIKDQRIIRKDRYSKNELQAFIDKNDFQSASVISSSLPFIQNQTLRDFTGKDDIYLAFGNLYYQEKEKKSISVAPLVFFKVAVKENDGVFSFRLSYDSPLFNIPLFLLLNRDYRTEINIEKGGFDYKDLLRTVQEKLTSYSFAPDDSLTLLEADVMREISQGRVVSRLPRMSSDPTFRCLEEDLTNAPDASFGLRKDLPSYIADGLSSLASHPVIKIEQLDSMNRAFLHSVLDEYILHKKTILLLAPTKDKEAIWKKDLTEDYYDAFMPYESITEPGTALFTLIEAVGKKPYYLLDSSLMMAEEGLKEAKEKVQADDSQMKAISLPTEENWIEIYHHLSEADSRAEYLFSFTDQADYIFADYLADSDFLSYLDLHSELLSSNIGDNPFYGLDYHLQESQYVTVLDFLRQMQNEIKDFKEGIAQADLISSGWSDLKSLSAFDKTVPLFSIYSEYEGFPLDYFRIDFSSELRQQIKDLESCYRTEASISLSLDVLCRPTIWQQDFSEILDEVKDRRKEKELKKTLKDIVKITPFRRSFKTLIIFIDKYQSNHASVMSLKPKLETVFGPQADSLDGLLSIDKAADFISDYRRHQKEQPDVDFKNPFTERIFHDPLFSEAFRSKYLPSLIEKRKELKESQRKYRSYFPADDFSFDSSSLDEGEAKLGGMIASPESTFGSYLAFIQKEEEASPLLKEAMKQLKEKKRNLTGFKDAYLASLYRCLLLNEMKKENMMDLLEDESGDVFDLYARLKESGDILRLDTIKVFDTARAALLERPSYPQTVSLLKQRYHSQRMLSAKEALSTGGDTFFHFYPLQTASFNECDYLSDTKFDLAILDLRDDDSPLDLYLGLMMAQKVIIIGEDLPEGNKIPTLDLSLDKDLEKYKGFSSLPSALKLNIKEAFQRQGISLEENKDIAPGILIPYYFEKGGSKFALRVFYKPETLSYPEVYSVPAFLFLNYGIKTVNLYPLPYLVYSDLSIVSLYQDVKSLVKEMGSGSVAYESLSYDQRKKADYFKTLKEVSSSFPAYEQDEGEKDTGMKSSKKDQRPIRNIRPAEIADGIVRYLSRFTYLTRDTLIRELSAVCGTDERDVDFRLLFLRAENLLLEQKRIRKDAERVALVR